MNRRHLSHIALNIGCLVVPMAVAVAVVPGLIARLGQDRFGALALAWTLVGYFGWLDLGVGRALTHYLAQQEAAGMARSQQAALARKARHAMGLMGLAWVAVLLCGAPLAIRAADMSAQVRDEAPLAWALLAFAVPLMMWSACSIGVLEARSRFVAVNCIRLPTGVLTFCAPWLVALHTNDLRCVMGALLSVRLTSALGYAWLARQEFSSHAVAPAGHMRTLLRFGGWLTISNLVSPLLSQFDRFAIAALLSMASVTAYTVPFDALSRLPAAPIAMMGVLFPLLAHAHVLGPGQAASSPSMPGLLTSAARLMVAFWLPALSLIVVLGPWLLHWWIGAELASASLPVWNWLALGVLVNGFAHIPFSALQSAGRTDIIAKLHLFELLPYCLTLCWALLQWGIVGAAVAWSLRALIDAGILYACAARLLPSTASVMRKAACWALGGSVALALLSHWGPQNQNGPVSTPLHSDMLMYVGIALAWCNYHLFRLRKGQ